jgi:hypothetical protein
VSELPEGRAILEARQEQQAARAKAISDFVTSSPAGRRDALRQVQDYNRANPRAPITYSQLVQAMQRHQAQARAPGAFGLTLPKKSGGQFSSEGRFAHY